MFTRDCAGTARQLSGPWEENGLWFLAGNSRWTVSNALGDEGTHVQFIMSE